jgi:hypothetical protein
MPFLMKMKYLRSDRLLYRCFFVVGMLVMGGTMSANAADATQWQRWEEKLVSVKSYENPYQDCPLSVTYTGPGGESIEGLGWRQRFQDSVRLSVCRRVDLANVVFGSIQHWASRQER